MCGCRDRGRELYSGVSRSVVRWMSRPSGMARRAGTRSGGQSIITPPSTILRHSHREPYRINSWLSVRLLLEVIG